MKEICKQEIHFGKLLETSSMTKWVKELMGGQTNYVKIARYEVKNNWIQRNSQQPQEYIQKLSQQFDIFSMTLKQYQD